MYQDILFLLAGIALLTIGGNYVTDGAVAIARKLNVSTMMIGLTVVAFGSASPDLASSLVALFKGKADLAIGNIVGSCVLNVFGLLESHTITRAGGAVLVACYLAYMAYQAVTA